MKPMNLVAGLAGGLALLVLSACGGGGGGGLVRPEADTPSVVVPDPAVVVQGHDEISLPGFTAVEVDTAMFLLAHIPHDGVRAGGGRWLSARSLDERAPIATERTAAYSPDHARMTMTRSEEVVAVNPEVTTRLQLEFLPSENRAWPRRCFPARGECVVSHPAEPGVSDGNGRPVKVPIEDMPFISDAMREGFSEGVRTRNGIGLRYFASGNKAVPWGGWKVATATDSWSGYGAWNDWSGFGMVILAHNHEWDLYDSAYYFAIVGGDLTGAAPVESATYRGAAVAMANDLSFIADGSVELAVSLSGNPSFDITFADWQGYKLNDGVEIGLPTSIPEAYAATLNTYWNQRGVAINADGTFRLQSGDGAFYGPAAEEVAGKIDYHGVSSPGMHGAFGARRVDEVQ